MEKFKWDGTVLKQLRESLSLSRDELAKGCGVAPISIKKYEDGETCPGVDALTSLAEFFVVPLDYLLGRIDDKNFWTSYPDFFEKVRKAEFEAYMLRNRSFSIPEGVDAPWPYNVLEEVAPCQTLLTKDQEDGLQYALNTLPEKEREALVAYYSTETTLEKLSQKFGVSRERVRQRIVIGVRMLRHPTRKMLIVNGLQGSHILEQEKELIAKQQQLEARKQNLAKEEAEFAKKESESEAHKHYVPNDSIDTLELSTRSSRGLHRAGLDTIRKVVEAIHNNELINVQNLGVQSCTEIVVELRRNRYL